MSLPEISVSQRLAAAFAAAPAHLPSELGTMCDAVLTDRIEDTVDYRRLAALVRDVFGGEERLLLEGLAGSIADGIVERFSAVEWVRVRVRKPDVVLDPPVDYAAAIVERPRT